MGTIGLRAVRPDVTRKQAFLNHAVLGAVSRATSLSDLRLGGPGNQALPRRHANHGSRCCVFAEVQQRAHYLLYSNSRSVNRNSSYLSHFGTETVSGRRSREKEDLKWGALWVGESEFGSFSLLFWGDCAPRTRRPSNASQTRRGNSPVAALGLRRIPKNRSLRHDAALYRRQ